MKVSDLPDVWYGPVDSPQPDWREMDDDEDDEEDEESAPTSPLVIAMLGFDPDDMDDD